MFHENLKRLRKQKNISQDELAQRLFITRQTISKWERGLSVPDADLLVKLADILDVNVSALLDTTPSFDENMDLNKIAEQLESVHYALNEKNRRHQKIWKIVNIILIIFVVLIIINIIIGVISSRLYQTTTSTLEQTTITTQEQVEE